MAQKHFILIIATALAVLSSCNGCEEELVKVCPPPVSCIINTDDIVETNTNITKLHTEKGECSLGRTECDEDMNLLCVGYIKPILEECNKKDDDCDGLIDNGISWDNDGDGYNSMSSCLNPSDCDDNNLQVYPHHIELCDGIDNNCDTIIDDIEPVECWTGSEDAILDGTTLCETGLMECIDGAMTNCEGQVLDELEYCDGQDNDCNGTIDDNVVELTTIYQRTCGPNWEVGLCRYGTEYCIEGDLKCFDAVLPANEVCNNLDDNCDGRRDEELYQPCESICGPGLETCVNGQFTNCDAMQPSIELCDSIDNDCDGEIDEGCLCVLDDTQVCREDIYDADGNLVNCGYGIQTCDMFGMWGICIYQGIELEICDNWDNDCDGTVDMITSMCGNNPNLHGVGECRLGTTTCEEGEWGTCVGEIDPTEEICDGLDNDCDGEIDEELDPHDKVDMIFVIDISGSMCPYIIALYQGITTYISDFEESEHRFGLITHPQMGQPTGTGQHGAAKVLTPSSMVGAASFANLLSSLACNGAGGEKTTDVILAVADPLNPLFIPWRSDAYPYVISISDEGEQTHFSSNLEPSDIGILASTCAIGSCEPGDHIELFFIDAVHYLHGWLPACYNDQDRVINIDPADGSRYTEILKGIFTDVCF
jgi:hypothetical protein